MNLQRYMDLYLQYFYYPACINPFIQDLRPPKTHDSVLCMSFEEFRIESKQLIQDKIGIFPDRLHLYFDSHKNNPGSAVFIFSGYSLNISSMISRMFRISAVWRSFCTAARNDTNVVWNQLSVRISNGINANIGRNLKDVFIHSSAKIDMSGRCYFWHQRNGSLLSIFTEIELHWDSLACTFFDCYWLCRGLFFSGYLEQHKIVPSQHTYLYSLLEYKEYWYGNSLICIKYLS